MSEKKLTEKEIRFIHQKSLILGEMFKEAYRRLGKGDRLTEILLERYRDTRRQLPGDCDEHGSTRFGATEAYHSTQD